MQVNSILLLIIPLLAFVVAEEDHVLVLETDNFESEVEKHDILLIEFYAPWCGHCKSLEPKYKEAAAELVKEDPPIRIAKVDCIAHKDICSRFDVNGFPTIKLFKKGEQPQDYNSGRTKEDIVKFMKKKSGPVSVLLESAEDIEKFLKKDEVAVVGFFEKEDNKQYEAFKALAGGKGDDFRFGHTFSSDLLSKYNYNDQIVIFRPKKMKNKFEEDIAVFTSGSMTAWLEENAFGACGHRTTKNQGYFKEPLVIAYYEVDYERNPKGTQYWRNRVMKVAKKFAGKDLNFAVSNTQDFNHELGEYGMENADGKKVLVTVKDRDGGKYKMQDEFSMDNFEKFLKSYLAGEVEQYLKSEPIPESDDSPVKTVVAKNFDAIVNDESKDVLIEFYAPWCGHCKSLEPKYKELAEKLKDEDSVVIAKMDATANDVPSSYKVSGFPTIYYAPRGSKKSPKPYSGGREVKDFIEYLAKESTLTGFDSKGKKLKKPKKQEL